MTASNARSPGAPIADDLRARIVQAAARLLADEGREAATTRAVAVAAGVQPPTIYRLFGDKHGLLNAVAEHGLATYITTKQEREPHPDPVRDLRDGWDVHVAFGLAHPNLFMIMSGAPEGGASPAAEAGLEVLRGRIRAVAAAGRLKVSEARAVAMVHAAGSGVILTLLATPQDGRDGTLSETMREVILAAITGEAMSAEALDHRFASTTLRASLHRTSVLSAGEQHVLEEWLDRLADDEGTVVSEMDFET